MYISADNNVQRWPWPRTSGPSTSQTWHKECFQGFGFDPGERGYLKCQRKLLMNEYRFLPPNETRFSKINSAIEEIDTFSPMRFVLEIIYAIPLSLGWPPHSLLTKTPSYWRKKGIKTIEEMHKYCPAT